MRYTLKGYFVEPETGGKSWRIVADKVFERGKVVALTPIRYKIKNRHKAVRIADGLKRARKAYESKVDFG